MVKHFGFFPQNVPPWAKFASDVLHICFVISSGGRGDGLVRLGGAGAGVGTSLPVVHSDDWHVFLFDLHAGGPTCLVFFLSRSLEDFDEGSQVEDDQGQMHGRGRRWLWCVRFDSRHRQLDL